MPATAPYEDILRRIGTNTDDLIAVLEALRDSSVRTVSGDGVLQTGSHVSVSWPTPIEAGFAVFVTGSTATGITDVNGNPVQWTYTFAEAYKATGGYGGWATLTGGRTGTAYNYLEEANTATQTRYGNGVAHDGDYLETYAMQPFQPLYPVKVTKVWPADGTAEEYWLNYPNGEDGTCS